MRERERENLQFVEERSASGARRRESGGHSGHFPQELAEERERESAKP